jgi:antitoxin (DNA-binding transcriptional repressor) of toxin-antitoxin stability system
MLADFMPLCYIIINCDTKREAMKKLNIREARQSLARLEEILTDEGEVTIMRRGKAVARVIPVKKNRPMPSHRNLRMEMPRLRKESARLIREDRDAR